MRYSDIVLFNIILISKYKIFIIHTIFMEFNATKNMCYSFLDYKNIDLDKISTLEIYFSI